MPTKKTEIPVEAEVLAPEEVAEAVDETAAPAQEDIDETGSEEPVADPSPPKPKRTRKKKEEDQPVSKPSDEPLPTEDWEKETVAVITPEADTEKPPVTDLQSELRSDPILTVHVGTNVITEESIADTVWHEIRNAYRTRRILTGTLGGIEQNEAGKTLAIVEYKGYRIVIPLKEMVMHLPNDLSGKEYREMMIRQNKMLSNMLGAEIDFIVRGIDSTTRSIVASRREAMLKKREQFYMEADENGMFRVYDGRIVQARVIAVAEKAIRIEAFGVECSIMARDLSWDWIGDAHERFSVGDQILVRIRSVKRESVEELSIQADVKSVSEKRQNNLNLCRIQGKYAGKVTDVHKGVVYIRLTNGVNAIAHACYDRRMPGKKDDVSFAVTHIDEERGVALGIITRIIKQNL